MVILNGLKDLEKYINQETKYSMLKGNSVKQLVMDAGEDAVQKTVYDKYEPAVYQRSGGLKEDWDYNEAVDGMEIFNTRRDEKTGKDIAQTVITGQGYEFNFPYAGKPRDFIEEAINDLKGKNSELASALKQDMKANGFDAK